MSDMLEGLVDTKIVDPPTPDDVPSPNGRPERTQTDEENAGPHCVMCDAAIPPTKKGAARAKQYCSDACRMAGTRKRRGAKIADRQTGRAHHRPELPVQTGEHPQCMVPGCTNLVAVGSQLRYTNYCSIRCRQKMKRLRKKGLV